MTPKFLTIILVALFVAIPTAPLQAEPIRVGYVLGFRSAKMTQEYRIAIEVLMAKVFKGFGHEVKMVAYDTPAAVIDAFWEGDVDLTELSSVEYSLMDEDERSQLRVAAAVNLGEESTQEYLLLAPEGESLESLAGTTVRLVGRGDWNVGVEWLNQVLQERVGKGPMEHFGKCELLDFEDAGDVVLPTFFGKADACMVMRHQFELLCELNPQIAKQLKVVESSPPILGLLFVHLKSFDKMDVEELTEIASSLHTTPDGEQACTLMKIKRLSKVRPEQLVAMESFAKKVEGLRGRALAKLDFDH